MRLVYALALRTRSIFEPPPTTPPLEHTAIGTHAKHPRLSHVYHRPAAAQDICCVLDTRALVSKRESSPDVGTRTYVHTHTFACMMCTHNTVCYSITTPLVAGMYTSSYAHNTHPPPHVPFGEGQREVYICARCFRVNDEDVDRARWCTSNRTLCAPARYIVLGLGSCSPCNRCCNEMSFSPTAKIVFSSSNSSSSSKPYIPKSKPTDGQARRKNSDESHQWDACVRARRLTS